MTKPEFQLGVVKMTYDTVCAGCGIPVSAGQQMLSCIESCCGGCYRSLCFECVERAAALVETSKAQQVVKAKGLKHTEKNND